MLASCRRNSQERDKTNLNDGFVFRLLQKWTKLTQQTVTETVLTSNNGAVVKGEASFELQK